MYIKNKYIKVLITCLLFVVHVTTTAQSYKKKYTFNEINWTIFLPADFKIVDSASNAKLNRKGKTAMESSSGKYADISETRTLISATKNVNNYFSATITKFDNSNVDWKDHNKSEKNILYKTFKDKIPTAKIDSFTTTAKIDGLNFDKFNVKITVNERVLLTMCLFSKIYKGYDLGISYVYLDEETKIQMETILKNSKFGK